MVLCRIFGHVGAEINDLSTLEVFPRSPANSTCSSGTGAKPCRDSLSPYNYFRLHQTHEEHKSDYYLHNIDAYGNGNWRTAGSHRCCWTLSA